MVKGTVNKQHYMVEKHRTRAERQEFNHSSDRINYSKRWTINYFVIFCFVLFYNLTCSYWHDVEICTIIQCGGLFHCVCLASLVVIHLFIVYKHERRIWHQNLDIMKRLTDDRTPRSSPTSTLQYEGQLITAVERDIISAQASPNNTSQTTENQLLIRRSPRTSFITCVSDLDKYLKDFEETQKNNIVKNSVDETYFFSNRFLDGQDMEGLNVVEVPTVFRRTLYQSSISVNDSRGSADGRSSSPNQQIIREIWRRYNVDSAYFMDGISKLRIWISKTILKRIVNEIESVDHKLKTQGQLGIAIGSICLDTLISTAQNPYIIQYIPNLPTLVQFLQVSVHQQYVVQRIKELAAGNTISEYKWKSGGKHNDKPWEQNLPTDAELIMHLVCTYLDSQLPLLPCLPESRPFTSRYFSKAPDLPLQENIGIYEESLYPPHYQMVINGELQDIPSGHNNVFYVLLLFLHYIKRHEHGMLGTISLGRSGINILWTIESNS